MEVLDIVLHLGVWTSIKMLSRLRAKVNLHDNAYSPTVLARIWAPT